MLRSSPVRRRPLAVAAALPLLLAAAALLPGALVAQSHPAFAGFDDWVEDVMAEWKVPALGVAVVHDDAVLFARGYGYRDLENRLPADGDTLFAIGSNSKSFTAMVLAMLEDEGKLDWQDPVRDRLPAFRLHDEVASDGMTAVDLLSHRSGLPRHDLVWFGSGKDRRELLGVLRHLEPTTTFRDRFQYQNLMFMTAGVLAEEITGRTWEELVDERIFGPLGMERSNFSVADMEADGNAARPYFHREEGEIERIPYRNIDAIGPAGSINSTAREMARYVLLHLREGRLGPGEDAERLLSAENAAMMQTPQMVITGPLRARFAGDARLGDPSYGLGLMISTYRGHRHVFHGGGIDGFISAMEWLPQDGIGVVVLSNTSGSGTVPTLVARNVLDRLLGLEPVDWAGRAREQEEAARQAAAANEERARSARHEGTRPSHALADFTGTFTHPAYGAARISLVDDQLQLAIGPFEAPLQHVHYDVFEVPREVGGGAVAVAGTPVQFLYARDGRVDRLAVPLEPALPDIVFHRAADDRLREPSFLDRLTGSYSLGGATATVTRSGDALRLQVPGQPIYDLVPDAGTSFTLRGLEGFRVEFVVPEDEGPATALLSHQPNGVFEAERLP